MEGFRVSPFNFLFVTDPNVYRPENVLLRAMAALFRMEIVLAYIRCSFNIVWPRVCSIVTKMNKNIFRNGRYFLFNKTWGGWEIDYYGFKIDVEYHASFYPTHKKKWCITINDKDRYGLIELNAFEDYTFLKVWFQAKKYLLKEKLYDRT